MLAARTLSAVLPFVFALSLHAAIASAQELPCGQPKSTGDHPTTSDALIVLKRAVKLVECELCVCDVDGDGAVSASDALKILRKAVGQEVTFDCPGCIGTIVFMTSETTTGNLGGLVGADQFCQDLALQAELPGTYRAWLSSSTTDVRRRLIGTKGPFTLVDGTLVAETFPDMIDGEVDAPINRTESGALVSARVWTGTDKPGTACFEGNYNGCTLHSPVAGQNACADWEDVTGVAITGLTVTTGSWTIDGTRACTDENRLYCIKQSPCVTQEDCGPVDTSCLVPACLENGVCGATALETGADCTADGNPPNDVCGDIDSAAAGRCVECNTEEECTVVPDGAFDVTCHDFACVGVTHGSQSFGVTGAPQTFVVPPGITSVTIFAAGAPGGNGGGKSGEITATFEVTPGETLAVFVGGYGGSDGTPGYNGGGWGGFRVGDSVNGIGGGGGGASDVRAGGSALEDRILVAAGSGGGWGNTSSSGGIGGGLVGGTGDGAPGFGGHGGTQSEGGAGGNAESPSCHGFDGALGVGGDGHFQPDTGTSVCATYGGGGGGGGYYGGGGGGAEGGPMVGVEVGGGGGGSSWATPGATDVSIEAGVHSGPAEVVIDW